MTERGESFGKRFPFSIPSSSRHVVENAEREKKDDQRRVSRGYERKGKPRRGNASRYDENIDKGLDRINAGDPAREKIPE